MEIIYIYSLCDPITNKIRYIGQTKNIKNRFYKHIYDAKLNGFKNKRCAWIKSLLNKNLKPILSIVDEVSIDNWMYWEKYWINEYKALGFDLVNSTDGGEGSYNRIVSKETKEKMSKIKKGKIPKNLELFKKSRIVDKIYQFDLNGILIKEWESESLASKELKINNIWYALNNKRKKAGNFIWKYKSHNFNIEDELNKKVIYQYDKDYNLIKEWDSITNANKKYRGVYYVIRGERKSAGGFFWKNKKI